MLGVSEEKELEGRGGKEKDETERYGQEENKYRFEGENQCTRATSKTNIKQKRIIKK